jgi:hypothetical protein
MMLYCTLLDILGAIPLTLQLWRQMGQSLEAFGQWKAIVSLFFSCEAAVSWVLHLFFLCFSLLSLYCTSYDFFVVNFTCVLTCPALVEPIAAVTLTHPTFYKGNNVTWCL